MQKIGILGGTFNPIHRAHIILGREAIEQAGLQQVWFMPSHNPPHKDSASIVESGHRVEMIERAVSDNPLFFCCDFELKRKGTTYTADTLEMLQQLYPECSFFFIVGGDSVLELEHWYQPERIFKYANILAFGRKGNSLEAIKKKIEFLIQKYNAQIQLLELPEIEISSRQIRESLAAGKDVSNELPASVYRYIQKHHLYQEEVTCQPMI